MNRSITVHSNLMYRTQATAAAILTVRTDVAEACMVCNSNISYNGVPFTAIWIFVLVAWTALLAGILWYRKRHGLDPQPVQNYFKPARKYLLVVVVLYVFGLHLVAILFLPWLLLKTAFSQAPASLRHLQNTAKGLVVLLILSIPILYKFLPPSTSEVGVRMNASSVQRDLKQIISSAPSEIQAQKKTDSFAYQMFDVPVFGWVVQSPGFYRSIKTSNTLQYTSYEGHRAAWSRGPDGDFDLTASSVKSALKHIRRGGAPMLVPYSYDPTNGMFSKGDIVKFAEKPVARQARKL